MGTPKRNRVLKPNTFSMVTFHHYVEFLNEVSGSLNVNDGVVKHNDDIWIYLGDRSAQSDQIIYQHSRFQLRQAEWAPKPVIRVTWLGAEAYAQHYGNRLPLAQYERLLKRGPDERLWEQARKTQLLQG